MPDCARAYSELRDQVVDSAEKHLSKGCLKYFISTFQSVINSKRRSDYINNFNDLLTVLEKRGCIGEANVGAFDGIVMQLPNCDILKKTLKKTHNRGKRAPADPRLSRRGHWDRHLGAIGR
jgi:hypothetical protein